MDVHALAILDALPALIWGGDSGSGGDRAWRNFAAITTDTETRRGADWLEAAVHPDDRERLASLQAPSETPASVPDSSSGFSLPIEARLRHHRSTYRWFSITGSRGAVAGTPAGHHPAGSAPASPRRPWRYRKSPGD